MLDFLACMGNEQGFLTAIEGFFKSFFFILEAEEGGEGS